MFEANDLSFDIFRLNLQVIIVFRYPTCKAKKISHPSYFNRHIFHQNFNKHILHFGVQTIYTVKGCLVRELWGENQFNFDYLYNVF